MSAAPVAPSGVTLLLVEDDDTMARLVLGVLAAHGFTVARHVRTGAEALPAARDADIVVLDHHLPDTTGLALVDALRALPQQPGLVMITANGNEELAASALRAGADDYLVKGEGLATLLPAVVERVRRTRALRTTLALAEQELVRTERLAAIGELSVALHHEINNPLMVAFTELELLAMGDDPLTAAQREAIGRVRDALVRIRESVRRARELRTEQSATYHGELRMTALGEASAPAAAIARGRAVLLAGAEALARVTALLLGHAGFRVERARSPSHLISLAAGAGTELLVVDAPSFGDVAPLLRGVAPRPYRVVLLGQPAAATPPDGAVDLVMPLPFDPATFGTDVLALLDRP